MSSASVSDTVWTPDQALLSLMQQSFQEAAAALSAGVVEGEPGDKEIHQWVLLESIGGLLFLDQQPWLEEQIDAKTRHRWCGWLSDALSTIEPELLDEGIASLRREAPRLSLEEDDHERAALTESLCAILAQRQQLELVLCAADWLQGDTVPLDAELEIALATFDGSLAAELWRLLPLGQRREQGCSWAAPTMREKLWWHHRGLDLPADALDALATTARVLVQFPESKRQLDDLIHTEHQLQQMLQTPALATEDIDTSDAQAPAGAKSDAAESDADDLNPSKADPRTLWDFSHILAELPAHAAETGPAQELAHAAKEPVTSGMPSAATQRHISFESADGHWTGSITLPETDDDPVLFQIMIEGLPPDQAELQFCGEALKLKYGKASLSFETFMSLARKHQEQESEQETLVLTVDGRKSAATLVLPPAPSKTI